jgi:hypothetical protein
MEALVKRINLGDAIIAGGIGVGGAAAGLGRGATGLLAVAAVFASVGIRHLWHVWVGHR